MSQHQTSHATHKDQEHAPVLRTQEARQAATPGHVRYVLVVSLALAVAAGAIIWLAFFA